MKHLWRTPALLVALALGLATARAQEKSSDAPVEPRKLDQALQKLAEIQTSLKALDTIKAELEAQRAVATELAALRERVARLEQDLKALREAAPPTTRDSGFRGVPPNAPAVPATTGRILLRNNYPLPVTFIINGTSYPLNPNESWTIDNQPLGPFTREILGPMGVIRARETVTLLGGRAHDISVFVK